MHILYKKIETCFDCPYLRKRNRADVGQGTSEWLCSRQEKYNHTLVVGYGMNTVVKTRVSYACKLPDESIV